MRSWSLGLLLAAAALAGMTLPAEAIAASSYDNYQKGISQRAAQPPKSPHGICVCRGGDLHGRAGLIGTAQVFNGNEASFRASCVAQAFDPETGEFSSSDVCDETWIALPK